MLIHFAQKHFLPITKNISDLTMKTLGFRIRYALLDAKKIQIEHFRAWFALCPTNKYNEISIANIKHPPLLTSTGRRVCIRINDQTTSTRADIYKLPSVLSRSEGRQKKFDNWINWIRKHAYSLMMKIPISCSLSPFVIFSARTHAGLA